VESKLKSKVKSKVKSKLVSKNKEVKTGKRKEDGKENGRKAGINLQAVILLVFMITVIGGILIYKIREAHALENQWKIENYHTEQMGENVYLFRPEDPADEVIKILDQIYAEQETNQFGDARYAIYFMPGEYDASIEVKMGFYMEAAGLGKQPEDTVISALNCTATWLGDDSNHNACCNFWRGVSNMTINSDTIWAVSQATFMRRVNIIGNLALHDNYGWASGGFLADSKITGVVNSGSQQQWLSRNSDWNLWLGENWNMVFVGMEEGDAPKGTWPGTKNTTVEQTPIIAEKPYLYYDEDNGFQVFVPSVQTESSGTSWDGDGVSISVSEFYVADPKEDTAASINAALREGKNLLLTPGIYHISEAITVSKENTIVLGLGFATLVPDQGNACMETENVDGIRIAGLLFDAGAVESDTLLRVGKKDDLVADNGTKADGSSQTADSELNSSSVVLSDLFFRVGGVSGYTAKTQSCVKIWKDNVIGDNFWVWRADHGDNVAWDLNTAANGIIVEGDDVTMYALMVEHFQEYQTIWNGNGGRVYFYQSEIPYDVPEQSVWMSHDGTVNGYSSYKVGDEVLSHEAYGIGIYSYHRDAVVDLNSVMEVPDTELVSIHNICAIMITGNPGISHIINNEGDACLYAGDRKIIVEYRNGVQK